MKSMKLDVYAVVVDVAGVDLWSAIGLLTATYKGRTEKRVDGDPGLNTLNCELDYPLRSPMKFTIAYDTSITVGEILWRAAKAYDKVYRSKKSRKKYGVWGHDIDDLVFEEISISSTGRVTFAIGS